MSGLDILQQLTKHLSFSGGRTGFDDYLGVSKVLVMIDFSSALDLLKIGRFQGVIGPLIGINQVEFCFRIL